MIADVADQCRQARAGNQEALRLLLEEFGPQVWREIDRQIAPKWRASIDADDVMQVTYMESFLEAGRLAAETAPAFVSRLRRNAENNQRDAIRGFQRQKRPDPGRRVANVRTHEDSCVALVEVLQASSTTPSRAAARHEAVRFVERAVAQLPPTYARVVREYDLKGRPIAEVAAELDRSPGAVHMLRARAHERLRDLLGAPGDFFSDAGS